MPNGKVVLFHSEEGQKLINYKCKSAKLDSSVLKQLIAVEIEQQGKLKKRGITESFNEIFNSIEIEID
ncbi:MAG: hypothetical protein OXC57_13090 [Rhodobacteraceae bacterium]|nr:hypothetical protein [Paracoccaceae bacterium]